MIVFDDVVKRYPDGTVAVDHLSLTVPEGTLTVFVGPSGCGKTTSLRMINRMIDPTAGTITLGGVDVMTRDANQLRRGIGYVIQHAGLFPHRRVVDNVATVPRLLGVSRKQARTRAYELLERVGLTAEHGNRYPSQLSGGQQQRVGVARALAADPPVLLMDEPFSAVDPVVRKDLQTELLRLQGELHKTVVLVTHDIDEAITLGDRVAVMRPGGTLAQYSTPDELLTNPADDFVADFLGLDRGVRLLSFFPSNGVPLRTDNVAADGDSVPPDDDWILITDENRRPLGWLNGPVATGERASETQGLISFGHTFTPGSDSLRAALDSAVLSPAGYAVAVDGDGRVLGVVSQESLAAHIRLSHGHARSVRPGTATAP
ncbi:ABC transporter ATP-binding protein [Hoyosella rhizosphaerae]|uniref:ABC-type quaternary amine transporter n=1 Tax=Hoyosella rhizosphaerae TaxID=1755582 RepID=A0A916X9A4_9ACTN|nr:ABC transporter ATP-binding protein [Hoyosella rhizosphaerae]MBN4926750.1 ABC transporter ATP-binding protein [Hoyosella rhizosphaerae]GGC56774.1 proline/glycine betaine ABC transporter ATP-binding protein [Hoyosella rhizosphaerae]